MPSRAFREIFRYELSYRLRSPLTWIYWTVIWFGTLAIVHFTSADNNRVINAPAKHAEVVTILQFFLTVITAGMFGDAAIRDSATGMQSLFNTTPIRKIDYLGGRFAASFLVNLGLLMGMPLMVALSTTFPWLSHFNWAPFQVMSFVQPLVLFTIPNLLIAAAVIFTIAALTKNTLAMYLGGLALGILYLIVVNEGLGNDTAESLIDPFGIGALQKITSYWPPAEQTSRLIGFPGMLVLNRAIWVSVAVALLVLLYSRFSFTHAGIGGRRRSARGVGDAEEPVRHAIGAVPKARREFAARTRLAQLLEVARHSLADILRNRVFLLIVLGAVVLAFAFGWEVGAVVFDTSTWPVTHLVAGTALTIPMAVVFAVLIALVAGELVWKEREVGLGDITATAPIPDWVPFVGRLIALVAILVVMQALLMVSGIALQAIQGYYRFELLLYVKILFGFNLVEYITFAVLAMAVHVLVNNKNLGHAVVIATYGFTVLAPIVFGIRHNMLLYNADPGWVYSDLNGFGPFVMAFVWFKLYWAAWALLLAVIATAFWVRSTEGGARARLRLARLRTVGAAGRAAIVAALLILTLGGFVFYNTNVLHEFRSRNEGVERAVAYERAYQKYANAPQPTVVANTMRVEIYPRRPAAEISGSFVLVNATTQRIDSLHVPLNSQVQLRRLDFQHGARLVLNDSVLEHRIYALNRPMEPGDTLSVTFEQVRAPRGFPNGRPPTDIVRNGAYFDRGWLPMFGYRPGRELSEPKQRAKQGLPPRPQPPSPRDTTAAARRSLDDDGGSYVHMDVVIGTEGDQIAVTPGKLVREWRENGRRYFHYVTEKPVLHGVPVLSAEYAVREDRWGEIPLRIYYHPTHTFNLDRMMSSMKASLEYFSREFAPYPYGELRVVEFPRYASFARANPHTITFSEGSAFITRIGEGDVDRPFFVIAHETAHQWWGNALRGARVKGGALLSETMAQYGAMMVMEKTYSGVMARRFYDFEMDRYLSRRQGLTNGEPPLVEATSEAALYYHKGAVAMYTMRDMIGEGAVNQALRRFYQKHSDGQPPYPTSLDLLSELRAVTPDSLQYLITDLFETVTLWQMKTDSARAERLADGTWRVTLTVTAKKLRADSLGKESEVPMDDLVEIGVFAPAKQGERLGAPLYLSRHRVGSGRQTITVTLPAGQRPVLAGIDPYDKLIRRDRRTSLVRVTVR